MEEKAFKESLKHIIKKYIPYLFIILLCVIAIVISTFFIPIFLGLCFQAIEDSRNVEGITLLTLMGLYAIRLLCKSTRNQLTIKVGSQFINEIRTMMAERIYTYFDVSKFDKTKVFTTLTYDLNIFSEIISWRSVIFIEELLILLLSCIKMFSINPANSILIITTLIILGFLYIRYTNIVANDVKNVRENITVMTDATYNNFTGQNVLRAFSAHKWQLDKLYTINKENQVLNERFIEKESKYLPKIEFIAYFIMILNIFISAAFVMNGSLSLSSLVTLNSYAFFLIYTVKQLTSLSSFFVKSKESLVRVLNLYNDYSDDDYLRTRGNKLNKKINDIEMCNVSFSIQDKPIFDSVDLEFKAGNMYQIKGEIGSGKTTLLNLLTGWIHEYRGEIRVNNIELKSVHMDNYMNHIGYVRSDPGFFTSSIYQNLTLGRNDINNEEIWQVLSMVEMKRFVDNLEYGLDTILSKDSVFMSGGEKQRFILARELLKKPEVLLIDDALNAIDEINLSSILHGLKQLKDVIIIIASNLTMVSDKSDVVLCIHNNRVVREGENYER